MSELEIEPPANRIVNRHRLKHVPAWFRGGGASAGWLPEPSEEREGGDPSEDEEPVAA
jgi:hypothetical protein